MTGTPIKLTNINRRETTKLLSVGTVGLLLGGGDSYASNADAPTWHYLSLLEAAQKIKERELPPTELTQYLLDRINTVDKHLYSYVTMMTDQAMNDARIAEDEINSGHYRGPLHGIPIGIKDLCYTKGVRTMAGTTVFSDFVPTYDATVVTKLKKAGAIIVGKLALCEGAHFSYHPNVEVPVNPWDASRWSGISSSGSGVAVAAGLCFAAIGTDTAGSIRYPSAVNGCVGLKPTYGRVSRYGVFDLAPSMDHVGPMARTVADAAIMFEAMAGMDPNDPTSLREDVPNISKKLDCGVKGLRIGFDRAYATENVDADVVQSVLNAIAILENLGAEIIAIKMPNVSKTADASFEIETVEAVISHDKTFPMRADEYGIGFREGLEYGQSVTEVSYARAIEFRANFSRHLHTMLSTVDCLICPTMSTAARPKLVDPVSGSDDDWNSVVPNDVFAAPFSMTGVPTLSVPSGFSSDGLPLSIQFVGSRLNEEIICRVGHAYEQSTSCHSKHPPI